jgi:hypothetical protein
MVRRYPSARPPSEHLGELRRRVAPFVGVETEPDDAVLVRQRRQQRVHGRVDRVVAHDAHDEAGINIELVAGRHRGAV